MQYALILAGAAVAQVANAHMARHDRLHHKRSVVAGVEVDYVTVYETVTASAVSSKAVSTSSAEATSAVPNTSAPAPSATSSVASSAPVVESSSLAAAPTSTLATSVSIPVSVSASSSAPASRSYATNSTSTSATANSTGITSANLSPNGNKAGLSGYIGIQSISAFSDLAPYISWYSDYTPDTPDEQGVMGIGMLWGADGSPCGSDMTSRLDTYNSMMANDIVPSIMFGFYEPDCECTMSSDMSVSDAASQWTSLIAPLASKGTVLGSPSMCKQFDEDFLTPFKSAVTTDWDVTSIHINKPNVSEAQKDVEYYASTYGKPIWVSEFACVNDQPSFEPCTDQTQIDSFINDVVSYFEGNDDVVAYGPSNGAGLGDTWPLTDSNGDLSATGTTYLNAIKGL